MSKEWVNRPPIEMIEKIAASARSSDGGVDFGDWSKVVELNSRRQALPVLGALVMIGSSLVGVAHEVANYFIREEDPGHSSAVAADVQNDQSYRLFLSYVGKEAKLPLEAGPVILVNQSTRVSIAYTTPESPAKVREAPLLMWARKLGTTREELKARLASGERIMAEARYPELLEDEITIVMREELVNLSHPVRLVIWDEKPRGFGVGNYQRLRFGVEDGTLTFFVYPREDSRGSEFNGVNGLSEGLLMIWNNGEVYHGDVTEIFPEFMGSHGEGLLVNLAPEGDRYIPEIMATWHEA